MPKKDFNEVSRNQNWKILLYGKPGVGKTSVANQLDGRVYLLGFNDSYKVLGKHENWDLWELDQEKPIEDLKEFIKDFDPSQYDTLILDDISNFEKIWFQEKGRESKNGISNELQHYSQWTNYFLRFISKLYSMDINILTTCWEQQVEVVTETGQQFMQYAPMLRDSVRNTVMGLSDIVGRVVIKPQSGERGIILEGNDSVFAKNRIDTRKGCKTDELFKFADVDV